MLNYHIYNEKIGGGREMKKSSCEQLLFHNVKTPIGIISCGVSQLGVHRVDFKPATKPIHTDNRIIQKLFDKFDQQIEKYFEGRLKGFDLPLVIQGTEFQKRVWQCMLSISYGQTTTYGEIAEELGVKGGGRAVGGAANANHLPILIPCHRVVGANRKLTGFASGVKNKVLLLNVEGGNWILDEKIK